jgi:hypothetical protein
VKMAQLLCAVAALTGAIYIIVMMVTNKLLN